MAALDGQTNWYDKTNSHSTGYDTNKLPSTVKQLARCKQTELKVSWKLKEQSKCELAGMRIKVVCVIQFKLNEN